MVEFSVKKVPVESPRNQVGKVSVQHRAAADGPAQPQFSEQADQLAHALSRTLATNRQLEDELRQRSQKEQQLQQQLEDLRRALETEKKLGDFRSRFITLASHEFRTPFSTILSSVSLAGRYAEAGDAEKRDRHLEKIRLAVLHLTEILQDFLTVSQLDEDKLPLRPEVFDFCELVEARIEAAKNLERAGLEIFFEPSQPIVEVFSDRNMVVGIVQNLLTNAARFSKTEVLCSLRTEGEAVVFEVQDRGIGIPDDEKQHIFERFYRGSNAGNFPGIGLGLHISRRYAGRLGGSLTFECGPGEGSTFRLRLPKNLP